MTSRLNSLDYYLTGSIPDEEVRGGLVVDPTSTPRIDVSFPPTSPLNDPEFVEELERKNAQSKTDLLFTELDDFEIEPFKPAEGQLGNAIPPELIPTSDAPYFNVRYPSVQYTDAYLDDPIKFEVERVFYRDAIPLQLPSGSRIYERDISQFVFVEIGKPEDEKQWYSVLSISSLYNRFKVEEVIDFEFREIENA